jgi:hypothetical protein
MDRTPEILARAIVATSLIVVLAIGSVLVHLWLRRTDRPAVARQRVPALVNEPDGSVYDLTLKIELLEERLARDEQHAREQMEDNDALRERVDRLTRDLRASQQELARLRRSIPRRPEAGPPPANAPPNPNANPPGFAPGGNP